MSPTNPAHDTSKPTSPPNDAADRYTGGRVAAQDWHEGQSPEYGCAGTGLHIPLAQGGHVGALAGHVNRAARGVHSAWVLSEAHDTHLPAAASKYRPLMH